MTGMYAAPQVDEGPHGERLDDYPYDPDTRGRSEGLEGLEKLRATEDTTYRRVLWNLYWHIARREDSGEAERERRQENARRQKDEHARSQRVVLAAATGKLGTPLQRLTAEAIGKRDLDTLAPEKVRELAEAIDRQRRKETTK